MRPDPAFLAAVSAAQSSAQSFARVMERSTAPMRHQMERAEEFRRQVEACAEPMRRLAEEFGDDADAPDPSPSASSDSPPPPPATSSVSPPPPAAVSAVPTEPERRDPPAAVAPAPAAPERWKPPASTDADIAEGWALYERRDAPAWFVKRLREWWNPFEPGVVEHWVRLQFAMKNLRHELRTDDRPIAEFDFERLRWAPEDLVAYLEAVRLIPPGPKRARRGRPRKRAAELDVDQWVAAQLAADPAFAHLSEREAAARGPWGARTIGGNEIWKQAKRQLAEQAEAAAERAREEFEGRLGEDEEQPGIRVGRKSALGRQRITQEDRDHDRAAEDFIRKAEAQRKRNK